MQDNTDGEGLEEPPKFLNDAEVIKINDKKWMLPDLPVPSFTKHREENFLKSISVSPDYSRYSNVEDVPVSILRGMSDNENQIKKVIEADSEDSDIFDKLGFKELSDSSKDITIARHIIGKKHLTELDKETHLWLASLADEVADVYVCQPLIADETGAITNEDIENYLDLVEYLRDNTDSLTIVPVLHLSDAEGAVAGADFAAEVDKKFETENYPFIGITGHNPFTNRKAFINVREQSEKRLLVSQCPKKLDGSDLSGINPVARSHFYLARNAKVVLDKKWLPAPANNDEERDPELIQENYSHFEHTSFEEAKSAIPEFVSFDDQRDDLKEWSNPKDFELFYNGLAINEGVKDIRERMRSENPVLEDKKNLMAAIERFSS